MHSVYICPVNACLVLNKTFCLLLCCRRDEIGKVTKISYPFFHQEKGQLTCAKCTKEKENDPLRPQQLCWTTLLKWTVHWDLQRSTTTMTPKRFTTGYYKIFDNYWFMVRVRPSSYGCTREVAKHKRGDSRVRLYGNFSRRLQSWALALSSECFTLTRG